MTFYAGSALTISERSSSSAYHRSDEIQLCVGAGKESHKRESGGRGAVIARWVLFDNRAIGHLTLFLLTLAFCYRDISGGTYTAERMLVLPCSGSLQNGQFR
jgi:hypothetical protein